MARQNVTARVPDEILSKLNALAEQTGLGQSRLVNEALAQYLGIEVETVGDRLSRLEGEVKQLQQKLRLLGN